ncbi:MAG TPA: hypothetical protein VMJ72_02515 [Candidatus Paceibacterota bacterium]|nr:hypothetical protein [Candidatus Paceibacterota bacterium]
MVNFLKSLIDFRDEKKQLLHIILIAFIVSFGVARFLSTSGGGELFIDGFHIHHFYWGMIALAFGGIIGILGTGRRTLRTASVLVGVGIGVFADEIGLLLNCTTPARSCTYFFPDTYDIVVSIGIAIILLIMLIELVARYQKRTYT